MSLQSHLDTLARRHASLEQEIELAMRQPSTDTLTVRDLKRQKLQLKDEMTRLQSKQDYH